MISQCQDGNYLGPGARDPACRLASRFSELGGRAPRFFSPITYCIHKPGSSTLARTKGAPQGVEALGSRGPRENLV